MAVEDFRPCRQGVENRRRIRRSPEQARHRRQHRAAMARCRPCRRHRRRAEFRRRACRQQGREGQERRLHRGRSGDVGSHGSAMHPEHRALDLRHLRARQRHGQGAGEGGRRHLVLPHRGLCLRPGAAAGHDRGDHGQRRQGDRRRAPSPEHVGFLVVPCCRRRTRARRSSASPTRAAIRPTRSSRRPSSASSPAARSSPPCSCSSPT